MLAFAVSFIIIFFVLYVLLSLYEKYVEELQYPTSYKIIGVITATVLWPLTIIALIIFGIVKLGQFIKKT